MQIPDVRSLINEISDINEQKSQLHKEWQKNLELNRDNQFKVIAELAIYSYRRTLYTERQLNLAIIFLKDFYIQHQLERGHTGKEIESLQVSDLHQDEEINILQTINTHQDIEISEINDALKELFKS